MTIEAGTIISDFNSSYPEGAADRSESDNHHRLIKSFILATWPNVNAVVSASDEEANFSVGVTSGIQAQLDSEATSRATADALRLVIANDLSDLANVATARVNLGLQIGVNVQAYSGNLTDFVSLTQTLDSFIQSNGSNFVNRTPAQARATMGLGALALLNNVSTSEITDRAVAAGKLSITRATISTGTVVTFGNTTNITAIGLLNICIVGVSDSGNTNEAVIEVLIGGSWRIIATVGEGASGGAAPYSNGINVRIRGNSLGCTFYADRMADT